MKVTLITGASSGIGEAFARRLAEKKHNLVLVARSENKLHQLCDELMLKHKITAHYVAVDLNDFEADKRLFEETQIHGMEVDWLINNAGFGSMGDFSDLELERELEMIGLNVMALTALTHRYLKGMRRRKSGTIINVSSTAGFQPMPYMATYAATKAFVTSFSQAIAEENREYGITVTALCPGSTDTNFFATADSVPFAKNVMQSAEEVVDAGLKAVEQGKPKVVSGWINFIGSNLSTLAPDSLVAKFIASKQRSRVETKRKLKKENE